MPEQTEAFVWRGAGFEAPAQVPGCLSAALCAAKIIEPPQTGLNALRGEWTAGREWALCGRISLPAESERVFLRARGVRGEGTLFVNGADAGRFGQGDWEKEITAFADNDKSAEIRLRFCAHAPEGTPRRSLIGVYGGLSAQGVNELKITDCYACAAMQDGCGLAEFRATLAPYVPGRYTLRLAAVYEGEVLACEEETLALRCAPMEVVRRVIVPVPQRWRPGEENAPVLLRLTVLRAGLVCDDRVVKAGFREVEFAASPAMQPYVNGQRVFLRGAEWRCDAPVGLAALVRRLDALRACGLNCLRMYGLPDETLLELLDARGFLCWPVLPLDAEQAAQAVRRTREHACVIAYSCESVYEGFNRPAGANHPQVAALRALCETLDGARPFFGPVPNGAVARSGREELGKGVLADTLGPDAYPGPEALCRLGNDDDALIRTVRCAAMCENLSALAGGEAVWPPSAPLWLHRCEKPLDPGMLRAWFGLEGDEAETKSAPLTRLIQAETLRYLAERARLREKTIAGLFVGAPFEAVESPFSCALFDGETPRPAYYALQSALRPVHICARLKKTAFTCGETLNAEIDLLLDAPAPGALRVTATLYDASGRLLAREIYDAKAETGAVGQMKAVLPDAPCAMTLRLKLEALGETLDVNDYALCTALNAPLWPLAHAPFAAVRLENGEVKNACARTAYGVCCDGYLNAAWPGWGALLPGESRAVRVEARVSGLNLEPTR